MSRLILSLTDPMKPEQVGGKFSRQKRMLNEGLPVPRFFCLSADLYRLGTYKLIPKIEKMIAQANFNNPSNLKDVSQEIQILFQNLEINSGIARAVSSEFDRHFSPGTMVAVRSSMIGKKTSESEDSANNPFAGISETFLFVTRLQILEKIKLCWASGFSTHALLYRYKQGMSLTEFSVAVGIQEMVAGDRSFVLFTCNPRTAARETLVVAGFGIGEGVVQERVGVDHFFINPLTREIRRELGNKSERLDLDQARGSGLLQTGVSPALASQSCLQEPELWKLEALGKEIERIFEVPQDIEGTITREGQIFILQTRPIALEIEKTRVWTNANVTESFPGVTTPLTYSFSRFFYRVIFYDCYKKLGISHQQLHDNHETLDRMIGFLSGRIYYCLTSFYQLHRQSPLFPIFRAHWEKMMGFLSSYEIPDSSLLTRIRTRLQKWTRFAKALWMISYRFCTHERDLRRFYQWWNGVMVKRRGHRFEGQDPLVLESDFLEVWRQVGNQWGITLLNDTYLPVIYGWTEALFKKWGIQEEALLNDLLCGNDEILSVDIVLSAVRLGERIRMNPELKFIFNLLRPDAILLRLKDQDTQELFPEFIQAFESHLQHFGDRGLGELKMEQPSFRTDPTGLIQILQNYAHGEMTVDSYQAQEKKLRKEADHRLKHALKGKPFRKLILALLLPKLRKLIRNRENSRYCRSELFGYSKQVFSAIGQYFEREKILSSWKDVFFLTQDEIFGYLDGTGVTNRLQALVELRQKEYQDHQKLETATQITTVGAVRNTSFADEAKISLQNGELKGLGSSSGRVQGYAHVVLNPHSPVNLGKEGILIARETDPGWLFLMLSAKGIIVERGSMLSHTAITGRKFGIPTVVALDQATTRIPEGALIEMDGATGVVKILSPQKSDLSEGLRTDRKSREENAATTLLSS